MNGADRRETRLLVYAVAATLLGSKLYKLVATLRLEDQLDGADGPSAATA